MPLTSPRAKDTRVSETPLRAASVSCAWKNSLISDSTYMLMLAASVPDSCGTGTF